MRSYRLINETNLVPTVTVAMLTYNHEKYISQAIESVLMQETSFDVQLVIAEDCSTDSTRFIVLNYQKKYPDRIIVILQEKNVGAQVNNLNLFENLNGKYIAALEGDDFWTDPHKLQKQVDFLENHSDYAFCFSNIVHVDEKGQQLNEKWPNRHEEFTISFRLLGEEYYVPTPTLIFRNNLIDALFFNEFLSKAELGDYMIISRLLLEGKGYYTPEVFAAYRHHNGGVFSKKDLQKKVNAGLSTREVFAIYLLKKVKLLSLFILKKNTRNFKKRYM